ncbi:hypothetical protein ERJ75_000744200 [Trypanosoma vivax]|uniref:Uncharacterized protein n=1 Tax=Trypanosoma vivax (strain Y486) TaxID=1055687 RepID=G0TYT1_TRYVY|nr:hypothetical protein TRVL_05024 [Trypanosoma vivax]KAH8613651.1 hypothetical protein ERJ75_000744200 [Trypanosoma vivax]CCC49131.1 conserved hypothetical protein [Trypanosoma vivax Y486]
MPQVHIFENGARSSGGGFVKPPSSGMWQCTISLELTDEDEDVAVAPTPAGRRLPTPEPSPVDLLPAGDAELITEEKLVAEDLQPCSNPRTFQLVSTSSKCLCSGIAAPYLKPVSDIQFVCLQPITEDVQLPHGTGIAFASGVEATWADVASFVKGKAQTVRRTCAEYTDFVWQLRWSVRGDADGISLGSEFVGHVVALLPLNGRVDKFFTPKEECLFVAIASVAQQPDELQMVKEEEGRNETVNAAVEEMEITPLRTPSDRAPAVSTEPPVLEPKAGRGVTSPSVASPLCDLDAEFAIAGETEDCINLQAPPHESLDSIAVAVAYENCGAELPTYAEVLKRGMQAHRRDRSAPAVNAMVKEWKQLLVTLRNDLDCESCERNRVGVVKRQLHKHECQLSTAIHGGGLFTSLVSASLRELLCDVQLGAATCCAQNQRARNIVFLLKNSIKVAEELNSKVKAWSCGNSEALKLSQLVILLRLVRHRCYATVLLGKSVCRSTLCEGLDCAEQLLTLLKETRFVGNINVGNARNNSDASTRELQEAIQTAVLCVMELSLFSSGDAVLCNSMVCCSAELFLWLRDKAGGKYVIPFTVIGRLEQVLQDEVGSLETVRELLQRCQDDPPVAGNECEKGREGQRVSEFCCGVVRSPPNGAVFDQRFVRMKALLTRFGMPVTITEEGTATAPGLERKEKKEN